MERSVGPSERIEKAFTDLEDCSGIESVGKGNAGWKG